MHTCAGVYVWWAREGLEPDVCIYMAWVYIYIERERQTDRQTDRAR